MFDVGLDSPVKPLLKSKRLWLTLTLLAVLAIAFQIVRPRPPRQIITLETGDRFEFVGTSYGSNSVPPSVLCQMIKHLPGSVSNLAVKVLGKRVVWPAILNQGDGPPLVFWVRRLPASNTVPIKSLAWAGLTDQSQVRGYETLDGSLSWYSTNCGWAGVGSTIIPRRTPLLTLKFNGPPGHQSLFTVPNPLYRHYPQWQPSDTLPATRDLDGLRLTLDKLEPSVTPNYPSAVIIHVSYSCPTNASLKWNLISATLSDATGNWFSLSPSGPSSSGATIGCRTLWPGEDAWRLSFVFRQVNYFPSNTIFTFTNVPIPAIGSTNFVPITRTIAGTKVRIARFSHKMGAPLWPDNQITVDLPDHPADTEAEIIDLNTPFGKPKSDYRPPSDFTPPPDATFQSIPTNATTMDITVAVQKLRTVDFYVKPPYP